MSALIGHNSREWNDEEEKEEEKVEEAGDLIRLIAAAERDLSRVRGGVSKYDWLKRISTRTSANQVRAAGSGCNSSCAMTERG